MPLSPIDHELHLAISAGRIDLVRHLLDAGANVNAQDGIGNTSLTVALIREYTDIAELLVARDANVNARDFSGWTPLMRVAHTGKIKAVRFLLEHDADTECEDENQQTATTLALWGDHHDVADLINKWPEIKQQEARKKAPPAPAGGLAISEARLQKLIQLRPKKTPLIRRGPFKP